MAHYQVQPDLSEIIVNFYYYFYNCATPPSSPPITKPFPLYIRVVQKNAKVRYKLADKLIPFLWGIIRSTENFKFLGGRDVLPLD